MIMAEALPKEGVDFRYLILEYYKNVGRLFLKK